MHRAVAVVVAVVVDAAAGDVGAADVAAIAPAQTRESLLEAVEPVRLRAVAVRALAERVLVRSPEHTEVK